MLNSGSFFVAGMLSGLDAMLDIDKSTLLEQVPLDDEIKAAIADYEGLMGQVLRNVLSYKGSEWGALPNDLDFGLYDEAYPSSLHWSQISMLSLHD